MSDASNLGLGHLLDPLLLPQRDCIHIAVVPVIADEMLRPGQKVRLADFKAEGLHVAIPSVGISWVGVIDPYLAVPVLRDQRCWLYLNPGSITSLRHDWTHPALDQA